MEGLTQRIPVNGLYLFLGVHFKMSIYYVESMTFICQHPLLYNIDLFTGLRVIKDMILRGWERLLEAVVKQVECKIYSHQNFEQGCQKDLFRLLITCGFSFLKRYLEFLLPISLFLPLPSLPPSISPFIYPSFLPFLFPFIFIQGRTLQLKILLKGKIKSLLV